MIKRIARYRLPRAGRRTRYRQPRAGLTRTRHEYGRKGKQCGMRIKIEHKMNPE